MKYNRIVKNGIFSHPRISMTSRRYIFKILSLFLLAWIFITPLAQAISIGDFAPLSLNITEIIGSHSDGTMFSFDFGFSYLSSSTATPLVTGSSSFGYLNVVAGSNWLIQNEPIPLIDDIANDMNYFWFNSLVSDFSSAAAIFNDVPFGSMPIVDSDWSSISAGGTIDWGAEDPSGGTDEGVLVAGNPPPTVQVIEGYLRGGVPDIEQLHNECGPTSVTNSLLWLIDKYNLITDKLPQKPNGELDEQKILTQLAKAINPDWDDTQPVADNNRGYTTVASTEIIAGKKKFAEDNKLPIEMHGGWNDPNAKGEKTFDFIKKELKKGQDVELSVKWDGPGAHWVTVVGYIDAGKDKKTLIVHDPDDKSNGNVYWKMKDDGNFTTFAGKTQVAVAESPIPEPATIFLFGIGLVSLAGANRRKLRKVASGFHSHPKTRF